MVWSVLVAGAAVVILLVCASAASSSESRSGSVVPPPSTPGPSRGPASATPPTSMSEREAEDEIAVLMASYGSLYPVTSDPGDVDGCALVGSAQGRAGAPF